MIDVKQFSSDKILSHIDRVHEWISTGRSRPVTYEVDMTNICNNRCPFCFGFYNREKSRHRLSKKLALRIMDEIKGFGGRGVTFTGGGEPLCHPAALEVAEYAHKLGLDVGFITNGLLLSRKAAEAVVNSVQWIRISMDAGSKEVYRRTHGLDGNAFEKILGNIENLISLKKSARPDITVGLGYLTPPPEKEDMKNFVLLGKKLGADYVQFRPVLRRFGEKRIDFDTRDTIEAIRALHLDYSDKNFRVLFSQHKYEALSNGHIVRPYDVCHGHNFATVIAADARMYLCCHTRGLEKYCLGDLRKNSLEEIWGSEKRKEAYERIDFNDCPYLCRCDSFNTLLWSMKRDKVHPNFL